MATDIFESYKLISKFHQLGINSDSANKVVQMALTGVNLSVHEIEYTGFPIKMTNQ